MQQGKQDIIRIVNNNDGPRIIMFRDYNSARIKSYNTYLCSCGAECSVYITEEDVCYFFCMCQGDIL